MIAEKTHLQSIVTELTYLRQNATIPLADFLGQLVKRRVMERHLWVAIHKFRGQGDYTFLIEGDEGRVAFVVNAQEKGIGERFLELIGERLVKRLIVASPYWDPSLTALGWMQRRLEPGATAVLVQPKTALFPVHALPRERGTVLFDTDKVKGTVPSRFAHAKVFVAETDDGDCVLFGSANCTLAALGREGGCCVGRKRRHS